MLIILLGDNVSQINLHFCEFFSFKVLCFASLLVDNFQTEFCRSKFWRLIVFIVRKKSVLVGCFMLPSIIFNTQIFWIGIISLDSTFLCWQWCSKTVPVLQWIMLLRHRQKPNVRGPLCSICIIISNWFKMEVLMSIFSYDCESENCIQFPSTPASLLLSRLIKLLTLGLRGGLNTA